VFAIFEPECEGCMFNILGVSFSRYNLCIIWVFHVDAYHVEEQMS
jgi:hypothetical protein